MRGPVDRLRRWLLYSTRPPRGATHAEVRRAGLAVTGFGLGILTLGIVFLLVLMESVDKESGLATRLSMPVFVVGFVVLIIGGYRAVFGSEPDESQSTLKRIAFGVAFGFGALLLLVCLAALVGSAFF